MMGYGDEDKGPAAAKFGVGLEIRWTDGRIIINLSLWGPFRLRMGGAFMVWFVLFSRYTYRYLNVF